MIVVLTVPEVDRCEDVLLYRRLQHMTVSYVKKILMYVFLPKQAPIAVHAWCITCFGGHFFAIGIEMSLSVTNSMASPVWMQ